MMVISSSREGSTHGHTLIFYSSPLSLKCWYMPSKMMQTKVNSNPKTHGGSVFLCLSGTFPVKPFFLSGEPWVSTHPDKTFLFLLNTLDVMKRIVQNWSLYPLLTRKRMLRNNSRVNDFLNHNTGITAVKLSEVSHGEIWEENNPNTATPQSPWHPEAHSCPPLPCSRWRRLCEGQLGHDPHLWSPLDLPSPQARHWSASSPPPGSLVLAGMGKKKEKDRGTVRNRRERILSSSRRNKKQNGEKRSVIKQAGRNVTRKWGKRKRRTRRNTEKAGKGDEQQILAKQLKEWANQSAGSG